MLDIYMWLKLVRKQRHRSNSLKYCSLLIARRISYTLVILHDSPLLLTFETSSASAGQKLAAKCAEAIRHCSLAGQTTDIYSYSSRKTEVMHIVNNQDTTMTNKTNTKTHKESFKLIYYYSPYSAPTFNLQSLLLGGWQERRLLVGGVQES